MATESDKSARRRKPLRRTAWGLLIGGVVTLGLMVGVGLLLLAGGEDVGPGRSAVWPAGERASVHKHPGLPADRASFPVCEVTGPDGHAEPSDLDWTESVRSPTEVTIRCGRDAIFLTGAASSVASALQSPLILVPVGVALFGVMLFFPRLTLLLATRSGARRKRLLERWFGE